MRFASVIRVLKTPGLMTAALMLGSTAAAHAAGPNAYDLTVLIANRPEYHPTVMVDEKLVNGWGIALRPPGAGGHIWISNAGTGTTTTYIGDVPGNPLHQDGLEVVPIQAAPGQAPYAPQVTGQVYNAASDVAGQPVEFFVSGPAQNNAIEPPTPVGSISGPAKFVFVTLEGTINAWRSATNPGMVEAVVVKDFSGDYARRHGLDFTPTFTGVAMTTDPFTLDEQGHAVADNRLYVADFGNNRIWVFDHQWKDISGQVVFERPSDLQLDFSPFNVQAIGDRIYVAYAGSEFERDAPSEPIRQVGEGRIVAYDRDGHIVQDFPDQLTLNAPWGVAVASTSFGAFGGKLLVGNFGDGTIAAYDPESGASLGHLRATNGEVIHIDGLWGLTFGNGVALGDANSLYFAAGPNLESDGLFGKLTVPEPGMDASVFAGLGLLGLLAGGFAVRRARLDQNEKLEEPCRIVEDASLRS